MTPHDCTQQSKDHNDCGATAVEYGLLVALIAAIIIGAVTALGLVLPGLYTVIF